MKNQPLEEIAITEASICNQCSDETEQIIINIPCRMAKRIEKYANETGNTITGVVIEAIDALLSRAIKT